MIRLLSRSTLFPYTTLFRSNTVGLLMYRYARERASVLAPRSTTRAFWRVDQRRLLLAAVCGLLLSGALQCWVYARFGGDRKSTRLNSSHLGISYAVFCLKKK